MKKLTRVMVLILALMIVAPSAMARPRRHKIPKNASASLIDPASIQGLFVKGSSYIPLAAGFSNLHGETSTGVCCQLFGNCGPVQTFDVNSTAVFNTYFTDVSNGGLQTYLFSLAIQIDIGNLIVYNGVTVTFDLSGLPPGEDFTGCIYVPISMPPFLSGNNRWGAGVFNTALFERLQGQLGTFTVTNNVP